MNLSDVDTVDNILEQMDHDSEKKQEVNKF